MRKFLFVIIAVIALTGCGSKEGPSPADVAGKAAEQYYSYLLHRDYSAFVDGMNYANPIPKDYRRVLEDNAASFLHDQDSIHGGIKSAQFSRANIMPNDSTAAAVYLMLTYGNNTKEEVLVPMVKRNDVWYMK